MNNINMVQSVNMNTVIKNVGKKINELMRAKGIKYSIMVGDKEIDVREEIAASFILVSDDRLGTLLVSIFENVDEELFEKLQDFNIGTALENCVVLKAATYGFGTIVRVLIYKLLTLDYKYIGELLAYVIVLALEHYNNRGVRDLRFGIDDCIIRTMLYWANQVGIYKIIESSLPKQYFLRRVRLNRSYEDVILEANGNLQEVYYKYKLNEISKDEFISALVSENGKLTIPTEVALVTSPEFSWRVVRDTIGDINLSDMGYDDKLEEVISSIIQCYYLDVYNHIHLLYNFFVHGCYYFLNKNKIKSTFNTINSLQSTIDRLESKIKDYKATVKENTKLVNELSKDRLTLEMKVKELTQEIDRLKSIGIVDIESYKQEIETLKNNLALTNEKLEESINKTLEQARIIQKKDNIIEELDSRNSELYREIEELNQRVNELRCKYNNVLTSPFDDNIPLECYINAIKDKRIVVVGGDPIHSTLNNYGFSNMRLVSASCRSLVESDIKNADLLVIITNHNSHASSIKPKNIAQDNGVPILYFNYKSAQRLCREIFKVIYSNK